MDAPVSQSKLGSAIETVCNVGTGFVLSFILWQVLAYILDIPMPLGRNFFITSCFTVLSLTRSYFWRRFFATGLNKVVSKWLNVAH